MEYEIRLRENRWDVTGGWNWRVWEQAFGGKEKMVGWGWEVGQSDALTEANNFIEYFRRNADAV